MVKKKFVILFLVCLSMINITASDFNDLIKKYLDNQNKVKSLVCSGTIDIYIYDENNVLKNNFNSRLLLYMKAPDLFKLITKDPIITIIVQKGDIISKKIGDDGAVITEKVKENSDLFARYFNLGMDKIEDSKINIIKKEYAVEDGIKMIMFRIKIDNENNTGEVLRDIYFYENGMIAKNIVYGENNEEIINISLQYKKEDNIYIINELKMISYMDKIKLINKIRYNTINVNTNLSDKEFIIKQ